MRTDGTGDAGRGSQDLDQPIWEARYTGTLFDAEAPAYADQTRPGPTNGFQDTADETRSVRSGAVRSGSRHGAHKAARRRDSSRKGRLGVPAGSRGAAVEAEVEKGPRNRGELVRTGIRGLGQTLITFGLIVLLFVVYELYVTDLLTNERQEELTQELRENWEDDPTLSGPDLPGGGLSEIPLGDGFAFIRIPAFGADYVKVVIEGTDPDELEQGPGHYVDSAMPGELGNFSLAGHRVGKGSPFLDLDRLQPGDAIVIETADTWFTYRVLGDPATGNFGADPSGIPGQEIVSPQDVDVVFPIPGVDDTSVAPTNAYLTLTTCHPKFSAEQRLIVHAVLDGPGLPAADYPDGPPALTEG